MYQANIRDLITKLPQSNKTEHFLMNKFSNQDKVQQNYKDKLANS